MEMKKRELNPIGSKPIGYREPKKHKVRTGRKPGAPKKYPNACRIQFVCDESTRTKLEEMTALSTQNQTEIFISIIDKAYEASLETAS